ncbi:MAG TPA: polyprenyl synthetase family protein [Elusimicrobiales bacterium]|nr:polyprenyl synthetase family protein [Elusimicrobiales bacterium]
MATQTQDIEVSMLAVRDGVNAALAGIDREFFDFTEFPSLFLGKAARARFTLLTGRALNLDEAGARKIAVAAELTHTASLLHDDCIDLARCRRGQPTINERRGINAAILVGDLTIALAFDLASGISPDLARELVLAVRRMTEGALLEENSSGRKISAETAGRIVILKTGALFRWCSLAACSLAGRRDMLEACARIGSETGAAFQVIDDVLDFDGDPGECGKETLKDISEGKFTLPLILALNDPGTGPRAAALISDLKKGPAADLTPALGLAALVKEGGFTSIARTSALERIKSLSPLIDTLPNQEGAQQLKYFLLALAERKI